MKRNRVATFAIFLLIAFCCGAGSAQQKSAPAPWASTETEVVQSDGQGPFEAFATAPLDQRAPQLKAGETEFTPSASADKVSYPAGAGTGGGDMLEIEPNNNSSVANQSHDVPFDCIGQILFPGDADYTEVFIAAGTPIQANAFTKLPGGINSPLDPVLFVYASNGLTIVTANDDIDFPTNLNSQVNFVAPYTGTYYFAVRAAYGWMGGAADWYVLSVMPVTGNGFDPANAEDEPNNDPNHADAIVPPGVRIGVINVPNDIDFTYFDVQSTATVVVDVCARVFGFATDPMVMISDTAGHVLYVSDDVDGVDPRFNLVVPPGRYFLRVFDYAGNSGVFYAYVVNVSLQDSTGSPLITNLKYSPSGLLKKVVGANFSPSGSVVQVNEATISTVPSAPKPTTVIKVKPNRHMANGDRVTVLNPNDRVSNSVVIVP